MKIRGNKFMVWNTHINKMSIKPVHLGSLLAEFNDEHKMWQVTYPGLEFREFTRLTDKNGKEIYEGDVAQVEWSGWKYKATVNIGEFYVDLSIGGNEKMLCYGVYLSDINNSEQRYDDVSALFEDLEFEVIGNIYEHPHLLEGVK